MSFNRSHQISDFRYFQFVDHFLYVEARQNQNDARGRGKQKEINQPLV